jgi:hypothetical protein
MALWLVIEPPYSRVIAAVGVQMLRLVESPRMTDSVRAVGPYALVSHTEAYKNLADQRPELRTHHNNVPLLVALILAAPGVARTRRVRSLLITLSVLCLTHVLDFMLAIHWHYALVNVGPYQVTDLKYFNVGLWGSLDSPAQIAKFLIVDFGTFYRDVGRLLMPILLWMLMRREMFIVPRSSVSGLDG